MTIHFYTTYKLSINTRTCYNADWQEKLCYIPNWYQSSHRLGSVQILNWQNRWLAQLFLMVIWSNWAHKAFLVLQLFSNAPRLGNNNNGCHQFENAIGIHWTFVSEKFHWNILMLKNKRKKVLQNEKRKIGRSHV